MEQVVKVEAQDQQIECFVMSKDGKTCYSGALDGRVSALWMNLEKTKEAFFDEGKLEVLRPQLESFLFLQHWPHRATQFR